MFANNFKVQTQFQNNVKTKKKKKKFYYCLRSTPSWIANSGLVGSTDFPNEK